MASCTWLCCLYRHANCPQIGLTAFALQALVTKITKTTVRHPIQMVGVETIWKLHTLTVMNSCLYYSARKPLSPGCGDANVINLFSQTFIIYMPLQHRPVGPGWRVSRTLVAMCTCTRADHEFLQLTWTCADMSTYEF